MELLIRTLIEEFRQKLTRPSVRRDAQFSQVSGKVEVAIGMRRTGKTYFVFQTIQDLLAQNTPVDTILYLNFEDDRLLPLETGKASNLIDAFYQNTPDNHDRLCHLFLDEIQNVEGWPLLVRRLMDTRQVKLYLTGSSAKLLSKEIATSLRGRSLSTEIFPYSFKEYSTARNIVHDRSMLGRRSLDKIRRHLTDYLLSGGFPELVDTEPMTRIRILQDYVNVVLFRDVVERHGISNIPLAKYLVRTLLRGAGKLMSINKLHRDLKSQGMKVSKNTLYEYIDHFEDAYLCFRVPLWSDSLRKTQVNPQKVYAIDTGVAAAFNADFSQNLGHMFENLVYLDLRRRGYEVYYYQTGDRREVDFLTKDLQGKTQLFQVCLSTKDAKTAQREQRALEQAQKELGATGKIITLDSYITNLFETE
jgi:uncharacterized protein